MSIFKIVKVIRKRISNKFRMKQFSCNKLRHSRVYFTVTVGIIEQLSCIKIENLLANTNFRS